MSSANHQISPTGPVPLPVSEQQAEEYLATLAAKPRNQFKDFVRDIQEPAYFIDIAALERALDTGNLASKSVDWSVNGTQWGLEVANGVISQGEGATIDLMYAASMPAARTSKPLIIIRFPEGLSMVDGSHRIARALIDGRITQPGAIVEYADLSPFRVTEADVENGACP